MRRYVLNIYSAALVLFVVSCKPNIDTPKPSSGSADFSKYIAIGNSLTAGFADGGLYLEGQKVAYPNMLAEQMRTSGGEEFTSPFFDEEHSNGSGYLRLKAITNGSPVLENVTEKLAYRDAEQLLIKYTDPIQNLGVPGMRLDLAFYAPFSQANMYFERLLSDGVEKSYFDYATEKEHTFFSLWLGNNDVLGYATAGGVITGATSSLTDKTQFAALYSQFVNKLTEGEQKGVVATIPDITAIPYFTTVTIDALLQAAKTASPENADKFQAIFIQDKTAAVAGMPPGVRPATNEDLVVLPFMSGGLLGTPKIIGNEIAPYGLHPLNPVEDQYILDQSEVAKVKDYVANYNNAIKAAAASKGLAVADVYTYLNEVKNGVLINGAGISATFITGGAISLDGIHLTPKGNALIANLFIKAINEQYDANLPNVDVNKYQGVKLP